MEHSRVGPQPRPCCYHTLNPPTGGEINKRLTPSDQDLDTLTMTPSASGDQQARSRAFRLSSVGGSGEEAFQPIPGSPPTTG